MSQFSIIIPSGNTTSDEKHAHLVSAIEKQMGTGPIIGEAKEVLIEMSRNIMVRDYLLESMGCDVKTREKLFFEVGAMIEQNDRKILDERKAKL